MRDLAMAGGTGEARRFCGWKRAVRPRPFNLAVAMLCTVRKAERAVSLRSFRFAVAFLCTARKAERAVSLRSFRFAVAMLCAVRKAERVRASAPLPP